MHYFLTGAVQIGKSTVLQRTAALTALTVGGFRTCFGSDRASPDHWLYLHPAGSDPVWEECRGVARFEGGMPTVLPQRFDALGVPCLQRARTAAGLILMDECGRLERDALAFQAAVFETLDGGTPVLGVLRQGLPGWTTQIAAHPNVCLLTVTAQNRDALPAQLAECILSKKPKERRDG